MKTRAKVLIIVSLMMLILPIISFADGSPKLYIDDSITIDSNNKLRLDIKMENIESANKIVALGINVKYDTSKLEFSGAEAGNDLNATLKYDDNFPDEGRFSIAILSLSGLKDNGQYYTVSFKLKDGATGNIPVDLEISEASDNNGNQIDIDTIGTIIRIDSDEIKEEKKELIPTNQVVEKFETTEVEPITSIKKIISEQANVVIKESDVLSYEVENPEIIELLDDGTIIPVQDGTSKVKLKLNGQDIGTATVEVKDGKIEKITGNEEIIQEKYDTKVNISELDGIYTDEEIKESLNKEDKAYSLSNVKRANTEEKNDNKWKIVLAIIITLFLIFIIIKKIKKGEKR